MQAIDTTRETTYAVQIRYRGGEWITLTQIGDRMAAVRRAASAYRSPVFFFHAAFITSSFDVS